MWEASFYEGNRGYLCPVYSLNHKIKGFQIRVDHPVNKRKYIWFTSSGFDGGTSSGSPARGVQLSAVQKEHPGDRMNLQKQNLPALRSGYLYIGIPGLETIRKPATLCLMDLKSRELQTVYECMDMDKMMDLTCRLTVRKVSYGGHQNGC